MKRVLIVILIELAASLAFADLPVATLAQRKQVWDAKHGYASTPVRTRWTADRSDILFAEYPGIASSNVIQGIKAITDEEVWSVLPPPSSIITAGVGTNGLPDGSTHRLLVVAGEQVSATNSASPQREMIVQLADAIRAWIAARTDRAAITYAARTMVRADDLTTNEMQELVSLFDPWGIGVLYSKGAVVQHVGKVWECLQPHTSQSDWAPGVAVTLWKARSPSDSIILPWVQPQGAHDAYALGALVTHIGKTWRSTIPANVYEPGQYYWEEVK